MVDNETFEFVKWQDNVPQYSGTPHSGIPPDAFVSTVNTQVLTRPYFLLHIDTVLITFLCANLVFVATAVRLGSVVGQWAPSHVGR